MIKKQDSQRLYIGIILAVAVIALIILLFKAPSGNVAGQVTGTACVPPPSGLVSWWPGDGNSNNLRGGNTGAIKGGVSYTAGKVSQGFAFDGTSGVITVGSQSAFRQSSAITYSFWVKIPPGGGGPIMGAGSRSGQGFGGLYLNQNALYFYWTPSNPGSDTVITASNLNILANEWTHVAVAIDFTNRQQSIYVNGQKLYDDITISQSSTNWLPLTQYSSGTDAFGGRFVNNWLYFRGGLDEVSVFNRLLSDQEIYSITNAGSAGMCKDAISASVCGNGFIESGEQCDDGNRVNGDGCTDTCRTQTQNSNQNSRRVKEIYVLVNNGPNQNGILYVYNGALLDSTVLRDSALLSETALNHNDLLICQANLGRDSRRIAVHPDGTKLYATNYADSTISVINTNDCSLNRIINSASAPKDIKVDSHYLYFTTFQGFDRINLNTFDRVQVILSTGGAEEMYLSGNILYLVDIDGETVEVLADRIGASNLNTIISSTDPQYRNFIPLNPSRFGPFPGRLESGGLNRPHYASQIDGLVWNTGFSRNYLRLPNGNYRIIGNPDYPDQNQEFTVDQLHSFGFATLIGGSPEDIVSINKGSKNLRFISKKTTNEIIYFSDPPSNILQRPIRPSSLPIGGSPTDMVNGGEDYLGTYDLLYFLESRNAGVIKVDAVGRVSLHNPRLNIPSGSPVAIEIFSGERSSSSTTSTGGSATTQSTGSTASTSNLLGHWPGDGNAIAIRGRNANLFGGLNFVNGISAQAFNLDGVNDYISVNDPSINIQNQLTVEAWIKASRLQPSGIVSKWRDNNYPWLLGLHQNNRFSWSVNNGRYTYSQNVQPNTWYYVVGTYDGSTSKLYVNGNLESSTPQTGNVNANPVDILIGSYSNNGRDFNYFAGAIDEVKIHNRVLSASEITSNYQQLQTSSPPACSDTDGRNYLVRASGESCASSTHILENYCENGVARFEQVDCRTLPNMNSCAIDFGVCTSSPVCSDPDRRNYLLRTTSTGRYPSTSNGVRTDSDHCLGRTTLSEYYCDENGALARENKDCTTIPGMNSCANGECIYLRNVLSCSDLDGVDYDFGSHIILDYDTGNPTDIPDKCDDAFTLVEQKCSNNNQDSEIVTCTNVVGSGTTSFCLEDRSVFNDLNGYCLPTCEDYSVYGIRGSGIFVHIPKPGINPNDPQYARTAGANQRKLSNNDFDRYVCDGTSVSGAPYSCSSLPQILTVYYSRDIQFIRTAQNCRPVGWIRRVP